MLCFIFSYLVYNLFLAMKPTRLCICTSPNVMLNFKLLNCCENRYSMFFQSLS